MWAKDSQAASPHPSKPARQKPSSSHFTDERSHVRKVMKSHMRSKATKRGTGEMALWVKVLAIKPDALSLISGTHKVEGDI